MPPLPSAASAAAAASINQVWAFTALTEQMMAPDLTASLPSLPQPVLLQIIRCSPARSLSPHYVYLNVAVAAPLSSLGDGRGARSAESTHDVDVSYHIMTPQAPLI